jgi:hypothetical protein
LRIWHRSKKEPPDGQFIDTVNAIGATPDEERQLAIAMQTGFDLGAAHRLVALLPLALSRPILDEFGVIAAPTFESPLDDGSLLQFTLAKQPEYVRLLKLARKHRRSGVFNQASYAAIVSGSSDIDAISNAKNAGTDVTGSVVASCFVGPIHTPFFVT